MLKTSYTLNLAQLFNIAPKFLKIFLAEVKPKKTQNLSRATINKQISSSILEVMIAIVVIYNHMAVIQIQIGKNMIEVVLLDGGSRVNIIFK
jgi:hypothetical protein